MSGHRTFAALVLATFSSVVFGGVAPVKQEPILRLSATAPRENPADRNDWCWGILTRIDHLKAYRSAQLAGFAKATAGAVVTYAIEESNGAAAPIQYEEKWTVESVDQATGAIHVQIERQGKGTIPAKESRTIHPQVIGDAFTYDPKRPESCGNAFVFAHNFGVAGKNVAGQNITTLSRSQFNLGGAEYTQVVSADVPFGSVSESLRIKSGSKTTTLIDFNIRH